MILYTQSLNLENKYLLLSISSDGWQIHCSPTYIIDFLDLELCSVLFTPGSYPMFLVGYWGYIYPGAITYINKYILNN